MPFRFGGDAVHVYLTINKWAPPTGAPPPLRQHPQNTHRSGNSVLLVRNQHDLTVGDALQMPSVRALAITFRGLHQLVACDPAILIRDLLHDRDRQTLRTLDPAPAGPCARPRRKHKLPEKQSTVTEPTQATLLLVLTLSAFCTLGEIQRNILND